MRTGFRPEAGFVVIGIPPEVDLDACEYETIDQRLVVTDSKGFALEINEFGPLRYPGDVVREQTDPIPAASS